MTNALETLADPGLELDDTGVVERLLAAVLETAAASGASAAEAALSFTRGLAVTVRLGETETVEHNRERSLGITVYFGRRKGSASTNDLRGGAVADAVASACAHARYTEEDPWTGLAEPEHLAREVPDLDLWHPWGLDAEAAAALAGECEAAALGYDPRVRNTEGATVSSHDGLTAYVNSHGFFGVWRASRHGMRCRAVAADAGGMQRDHWYTSARAAGDLARAVEVGRTAAARAVRRLGARPVPTARVPVVFEAPVATTLFGHLVGAVSGAAQYREASFLCHALGRAIAAPGLYVDERPHLLRAAGSAPFDADGVATRAQPIVDGGVLTRYLLSAYSARRLGLAPTGNAGGVHNVVVRPGTRPLEALLRDVGRGLLVTELLGFGVNLTTGDYSRGAAGFWIEDGTIAHPVEQVTVAGNLGRMLRDIVEVGADVDTRGNVRTGSVLIESMTVAGA